MVNSRSKNTIFYSFAFFVAATLIYITANDADYTLFMGDVLRRFITIPAFYWIVALIYFMVYLALFKEKAIDRLADFFKLGLASNILLLLLALFKKVDLNRTIGFSYALYADAYLLIAAVLFSVYTARKVKDTFFALGPMVTLYAAYVMVRMGLWFFSGAVLISFLAVASGGTGFKDIIRRFKEISPAIVRYAPLLIFIFAFLVRAVFAFILIRKLGMDYLIASDDGAGFDPLAKLFAQGTVTPFFATLYEGGYWVFLGTLYKIFGRNFYIVSLIQSAMGATIPVVIYLIAKRYFSKINAFLTGIAVSLDIMLIHLSTVLGMEALFLPALVFGIFLLLEYTRSSGIKAGVISTLIGVMFGIVCVSRIVLFPFIFIGLLWMFLKKPVGIVKYLVHASLVVLLIVAVNLPFVIKNYTSSGKILISNLNKRGAQHYSIENEKLISLGINPFTDPVGSVRTVMLKPRESLKAIWQTVTPRIIQVAFSSYFGSFDPIFLVNPRGTPNKYAQTMEFYVYVFLIIGLIMSLRERVVASYLIGTFMLYTPLIYSLFYILNARYRAPIQPFIYIYVMFGIASVRFFTKNGKSKR